MRDVGASLGRQEAVEADQGTTSRDEAVEPLQALAACIVLRQLGVSLVAEQSPGAVVEWREPGRWTTDLASNDHSPVHVIGTSLARGWCWMPQCGPTTIETLAKAVIC